MDTNTKLHEALQQYKKGLHTEREISYILDCYQPLLDKYTAILYGKELTTSGKPHLADINVRIFAFSFRMNGTIDDTIKWVVKQCSHYDEGTIRAEVISSFLQCLKEEDSLKVFPRILAKNIATLLGSSITIVSNDMVQMLSEDIDMTPPTMFGQVEYMLLDRGVVLTEREKQLLRALSLNFNITWAAKQLGISRTRASILFGRIRKKAQLIRED